MKQINSRQEKSSTGTLPVEKTKTKIKYDDFVAITNLIVNRINEDEASEGQGIAEDELVQWFLEEREETIHSEEQLHSEKDLLKKILKRLTKVRILVTFADISG